MDWAAVTFMSEVNIPPGIAVCLAPQNKKPAFAVSPVCCMMIQMAIFNALSLEWCLASPTKRHLNSRRQHSVDRQFPADEINNVAFARGMNGSHASTVCLQAAAPGVCITKLAEVRQQVFVLPGKPVTGRQILSGRS